MKITKKVSIFIILFLICLITFSIGNINVRANEATDKLYCNATINDNFDSSTIQIVLNDVSSASNKEYTINDFPEINCSSVVDVTKTISDNIKNGNTNLINSSSFKRVLNITITNPGKTNVLNAISVLEQRNDVYSVSPNYYIEYSSIPNDEYIDYQWAINNINLPAAWNINTGSDSVLVGVIDTGIDGNHLELENRVSTNLSKDFAEDGTANPLVDLVGHGTHVAGIIGAEGDNEIGVTGVCWDVTLVSLKVINESDGNLYNSDVVKAIYYAASNDIPIINMSLGSYYDDPTMATAIQTYTGLVVAAAGNEERNTDIYLSYPAAYNFSNIISVGASNSSNNLWVQSGQFGGTNYGKNTVDLFAPGASIISTLPGNSIDAKTGTSMATPHVAGVAALLLSEYPNLSAVAIKEIIMNGVDKCVDSSGNLIYDDLCVSEGKLNAYNSLNGYKTLSKGTSTNVVENLNDGKGLFGFSQYGSGFVEITMTSTKSSGTITYPQGSFRVLNDDGEVVKKCEMSNFTDEAINKLGQNSFTVFLPESGYYYIDVDYSEENLTALNFVVENIESYGSSINLFNYVENAEFEIPFANNIQSDDFFKSITLKQSSQYELDIETTGSARLVVVKSDSTSPFSGLEVYKNQVITGNTTITLNMDAGTYYIGYFDNLDNSSLSISMTRKVSQYGGSVMVTDPDYGTNAGSQITVAERDIVFYNRSFRGTNILEGFTRLVYFDDDYAPSVSRLDYDWYSSDENVAIVTSYGTVLAKNVSQNTTVKIMAVYKNDMSKVYVKEFTILNDTKTYNSDPLDIEMTLNVSAGEYTSISFGNTPVPINLLQYYYWSSSDYSCASVDNWGRIYCYYSAVGQTVEITGTYLYNSRVRIKITVNIVN